MSFRRLYPEQPDSFAFTPENLAWAKERIALYPQGRQASAVIPLLWRAQEQNGGWTTEPMIRYVADMLGMKHIRVLEIATFYTMFQLAPVGKKAHIQVCGTTPCMLRGAPDLIKVCRRKIAQKAHTLSDNGDFSWEEVECLGACANAPMIQIGEAVYEDLTPEDLEGIIDDIAAGRAPKAGPQNGRRSSEPLGGATTLTDESLFARGSDAEALIEAARSGKAAAGPRAEKADKTAARSAAAKAQGARSAKPEKKKRAEKTTAPAPRAEPVDEAARAAALAGLENIEEAAPKLYDTKPGQVDDLKMISGIGPKIEAILHDMGIWLFSQIASWGPAEIKWVDARLKFKGRIIREDWVAQADALAAGGREEYVKRFGKEPR